MKRDLRAFGEFVMEMRELALRFIAWPVFTLLPAAAIFPADCNNNGREDASEVRENPSLDCNRNGIPDDCDLTVPRLTFEEVRHFPTQSQPLSVSLADLDGDGDLEAITPIERTTEIEIHFNKGGALGAPIAVNASFVVWAVAPADLDGDGDLDLAVANGEEKHIAVPGDVGAVTVFANEGHGVFDSPFQLSLADGPSSIAVADVDRDGRLDLLTTTYGDPESKARGILLVSRNEGSGSFLQPDEYPVGLGPSAILSEDLNQDGLLDAAVVHDASGKVAVFLNKAQGNFEDAAFFPVWISPVNGDDTARATSLTSIDVEGNGDLDLVIPFLSVGNPKDVSILRNRGNGTFEPPTLLKLPLNIYAAAVAPPISMNGDTIPDLVVSAVDSFVVFLGASGAFTEPFVFPTPGTWVGGFALGDLDGDQRPDVALVSHSPPGVAVYLNTTAPYSRDCNVNMLPDECDIRRGASADGNGDGILDECQRGQDCNSNGIDDIEEIVAGASDCNGNAVPDACDVASGEVQDTNRNGIPDSCEQGQDCDQNGVDDFEQIAKGDSIDCNSNGIPDECDVITHSRLGSRRDIYLGPIAYPLQPSPADFDDDGWMDLALSNIFEDLKVLWNEGKGEFVFGNAIPTDGHSLKVVTGDLDGDGDVDLAASTVGFIVQLENLGSRKFEVVDRLAIPRLRANFSDPPSTLGIVAADLDNDGDLDLAASNGSYTGYTVPSNVLIYANTGQGSFQAPIGVTVGTDPLEVAGADFDGDGDIDLATVCQPIREPDSPLTSVVAVLLNSGKAKFEPATFYAAGRSGFTLFSADLDGDEDSDLFATDSLGPHWILWNAADGSFESKPFNARGQSYGATSFDINGDGLADLALGSEDDLEVLLNKRNEKPWGAAQTIRIGTATRIHVASADLTGDGKPDLALSNRVNQSIVILRNESRKATSYDVNMNGVPDECDAGTFRRGDANSDSSWNVTDALFILRHLFQEGPVPSCLKGADLDDNAQVDLTDAVYLLSFLFQGGLAPIEPFTICGLDPTADELSCARYTGCAPE
jgi:hypothetical protein